jgi:hypothetical protein
VQVRTSLAQLELLATSTDPEHLGILLHAESLLVATHAARDLREGILIAVMVQSRKLGHQDLQMSAYAQFADLLREKGDHHHADEFFVRARTLQVAIFGTTTFRTPARVTSAATRPSSIDEDGSVRMDFGALRARTWLGTLSNAQAAMKRGMALRSEGSWEQARGEFLTAYYVLETDGEAISDGALVRAQAACLVADTYVKRFLYEEAIPYAEHAVRIYQGQPLHRAPHAFQCALLILYEAYSVGPYYEERCEVQRLLDQFPRD